MHERRCEYRSDHGNTSGRGYPAICARAGGAASRFDRGAATGGSQPAALQSGRRASNHRSGGLYEIRVGLTRLGGREVHVDRTPMLMSAMRLSLRKPIPSRCATASGASSARTMCASLSMRSRGYLRRRVSPTNTGKKKPQFDKRCIEPVGCSVRPRLYIVGEALGLESGARPSLCRARRSRIPYDA
jgi:hypothetical protein